MSNSFPTRWVAAVLVAALGAGAHAQLLFTEAAAQVGIDVSPVFPPGLSNIAVGGVVAGDFNRDGWQDLFALTGGGAPDRLFINNGDGTFTDRAAEWGVAVTHVGIGPAVGDYDNDGWLDLFVSSLGTSFSQPQPGKNRLYRNNGGTGFTEVAAQAGVAWTAPIIGDGWGASFGDYDLDGDLDLFVTAYVASRDGNRLFRNNGDGTFSDVTATAIPFDFIADRSHGFSPRFVDMNGDRYPELLYVGDFMTSHYFINNRDGTFSDATASSGTGLDYNGMGHTVGDFNGDGLLDWYVTSIHNLPVQPMQTGNMLYMNQGGHTFVEIGAAAGVRDGDWGWGTTAIDFDHDTDLDLIATNGWTGAWSTDPTYLWLNDGNASFTPAAAASGITHTFQGRGLLAFDPDNDGDQDVVIYNLNKPISYYRNDSSGPDRHWLKVWLSNSGRSNIAPDGFGAKLWLTAGGKTQFRHIDFGDNYLSQNELSAHWGLGATETVDTLRVEWTTGEITELHELPADQSITISAALLTGDITGDGRVDLSDLGEILAVFGACQPDAAYSASADLDQSGCNDLGDLGIVLANYGSTLF